MCSDLLSVHHPAWGAACARHNVNRDATVQKVRHPLGLGWQGFRVPLMGRSIRRMPGPEEEVGLSRSPRDFVAGSTAGPACGLVHQLLHPLGTGQEGRRSQQQRASTRRAGQTAGHRGGGEGGGGAQAGQCLLSWTGSWTSLHVHVACCACESGSSLLHLRCAIALTSHAPSPHTHLIAPTLDRTCTTLAWLRSPARPQQ